MPSKVKGQSSAKTAKTKREDNQSRCCQEWPQLETSSSRWTSMSKLFISDFSMCQLVPRFQFFVLSKHVTEKSVAKCRRKSYKLSGVVLRKIEGSETPYVILQIVDDFRQTHVPRNCEYWRYSMCGKVEEPLLIPESILVLSGGSLVEPKTFITLKENSRATARAAHVGHTRPENHCIFAFFATATCSTSEICAFVCFAIFQFRLHEKSFLETPLIKIAEIW